MAKNSSKSAKPSKSSPPKAKKPAPKAVKPSPKKKAAPVKAKATKLATAPTKNSAAKVSPSTKAKEKPKAKPIKNAPLLHAAKARSTMLDQITSSNSATQRLPAPLQAVVDKSEISDLLFRVARGLDRIDETLLRSVFHHEATLDLGPGVFQGSANDYVHWVIGVMNGVRSSHHMITNILPTLERGVALVESYCHAHIRMDKPTGREDVFIGSRFLDRFERWPAGPAGVWKIMHRKQIIDWVRTEAVSDLFYHQNPDALWSYRTKTDISYQMAQFPGSQSGNKLPSFLGQRYDSKSVKF